MKQAIFASLFSAQVVFAGSADFGKSDGGKEAIPVDKMRYQLEVKGEILVFDKTGRRLLFKGDEGRSWWFGDDKPLVSNWSYMQRDLAPIALRHEWDLDKEGRLAAKISQYDSMDKGKGEEPVLGKLVREEVIKIENFESISWVVSQDESRRVVAKFEPILWTDEKPSDVGKLPINSGRMTIFDNKGNLWASQLDNSEGTNVYFGATTHMGTFYISYVPFKGAKEIGLAKKGLIRIKENGIKLNIESSEPFLPRGTSAKVYGFLDLKKRTSKVNSVRSYGSDDEKSFYQNIIAR